MSSPWKLVYALEEPQDYTTFKEAVKAFLRRVSKDIKDGLAWQILEEACWIEPMGGDMPPIMFYTARDIAAELGWTDEWGLGTGKNSQKDAGMA